MQNHRISARSSSRVSRFSNSTLVRVLCVVSCLFLIFGPIYLCLRAAGSTRDRVVADYTMLTSVDSFLQMNAAMIANAAVSRSREAYRAYLAWRILRKLATLLVLFILKFLWVVKIMIHIRCTLKLFSLMATNRFVLESCNPIRS